MSRELFRLDEVSFGYGAGSVLKGLSFALQEGSFYGILGPNGCGKTTLLDLLTGSRSPQQGSIYFRNRPLAGYPKSALAKELALVPQEFNTGFGFTVEEIVLMGRHPHMRRFATPGESDWQRVDWAIEEIGISPLRQRYTSTLSGGQKQRTVVARALAQDTPVLLFDEATSSLDIKYTLQIFNLARKLVEQENRTVIAVIHDLNLASAYCDTLIFLRDGELKKIGNSAETLTENTIADIFGVHAEVGWNESNQSRQVSFHYRGTK